MIKSLTAQLKEMAERLPLGTVRNSKTPVPGSPGPNPSSDVSNAMERLSSPMASHEIGLNCSSRNDISNGSSTPRNHDTNSPLKGQSETSSRSKHRNTEAEANYGSEWVEQDEPGVYITLVSMPGGIKDLKRVRFSRKRFSEKEAEQWWAANRARIYQQYNVPMADKPGISSDREAVAHST